MSPPRLTSTPQPVAAAIAAAARSAASALAVAPEVKQHARRDRSPAPRAASSMTPAPAAPGNGRQAQRDSCPAEPARSHGRSPGVTSACPQVGSTSPSVSRAAVRATDSASANSGLTGTGRPPAAHTRQSSESGRNREQAASIAASSAVKQGAGVAKGGRVGDQQRGERAKRVRGVHAVRGRRHQPPPCDVLVTAGRRGGGGRRRRRGRGGRGQRRGGGRAGPGWSAPWSVPPWSAPGQARSTVPPTGRRPEPLAGLPPARRGASSQGVMPCERAMGLRSRRRA